MADSLEPQDLSAVGLAYARTLSDDLGALLGTDIAIGVPTVETVGPDAVLEDDLPIALSVCKNKHEESQVYYCLMSRQAAVTLACLLMGQPEERINEMRRESLDEDALDAYSEVMNLATAVLSRMFTDQYGLPPVGVESTVEVGTPSADESWLQADEFALLRYPISIPGYDDESLTMVFPPEVAHAWFGMAIGPFAESDPPDGLDDEEDRDENTIEPTSIVFIEPSEELRNVIEDLEEEIIHSIWTMDPEEFDPDDLDEFADVGAFFIEWDLSIRTGLDFVECLRAQELTQDTPILMMSETPTQSKVHLAIRVGANSFITKPIDLEQIHAKLDPLLLARQRTMS